MEISRTITISTHIYIFYIGMLYYIANIGTSNIYIYIKSYIHYIINYILILSIETLEIFMSTMYNYNSISDQFIVKNFTIINWDDLALLFSFFSNMIRYIYVV